MFFKLESFALAGIEAINISVEIHISSGLPSFTIVGLPDKAVNESRLRVRAAIINSGYSFPMKRIIINLAPADIKKEGVLYDLPIAVALLIISSQVTDLNPGIVEQSVFIGELSLDGKIKPVRGIISMAEKSAELKKKYFFVPAANFYQAIVINNIKILGCNDLVSVTDFISGNGIVSKEKLFLNRTPDELKINSALISSNDRKKSKDRQDLSFRHTNELGIESVNNENDESGDDFNDIRGQFKAKRALEIAAAGMHNLMLTGPPGAGKTMLAKRLLSVMPDLNKKESIEVTKIYSLYKNNYIGLITKRPFINPHNTITLSCLIGGGNTPRPGEISLAHRGILFLDEFSLYPRNLIESLRLPLENKEVIISRNNLFYRFPCQFMLVVALNPCSCGFNGDGRKRCRCTLNEIRNYWKSISGPLLDRIDMRINVPRLKENEFLGNNGNNESSGQIKKRVAACQEIQEKRFFDASPHASDSIKYNSEAGSKFINKWISENNEIKELVPKIVSKYNLSARAVSSLIKVARTISDLEKNKILSKSSFLEALNYRINFEYE